MGEYDDTLSSVVTRRVATIVTALAENRGLSKTQICQQVADDRNLISYHRRNPSMTTAKYDKIMGRASGLWDDTRGEWPSDIPRPGPIDA